jgi:DNA primase
MARIKDSSVEAVKAGADFVAVVEERTQLRKAGARFVGRCPFHEERTPSFSVNPVEKYYHCFGCGAKGDMIGFVREVYGLDFVGSIEWLADRFRIPLEYEEQSPEQQAARSRNQRLLGLLEQATLFYERTLWDTEAGSFARDYLTGRGLSEAACREFRLGLSLEGNRLERKALEGGFTRDELRAVGLTRQRGGDYFQRRLLFPLADARGRVLGFQARKLFDDDPLAGKYVNTSDGELFHKGSLLYGLDLARAVIAREDRACVVEGNTDVIALRQAGFAPVVASMGTALTDPQLRELGRLTKRLWLAFDGDAAGESATLRGMELAVQQGFDVKVVTMPPGVDPADNPVEFQERLRVAAPYLVHRVDAEIERSPDRGAATLRRVKEFLDAAPDSPERHAAWRRANDKLGMTVPLRAAAASRVAQSPSRRMIDAGTTLERRALAAVLAHPGLRPLLAELPPEHFDDPTCRQLRDVVAGIVPADDGSTPSLAALDAEAATEGIDESTGTELLFRLRERALRRELRHAELSRTKDLQEALTKVLERIASLS